DRGGRQRGTKPLQVVPAFGDAQPPLDVGGGVVADRPVHQPDPHVRPAQAQHVGGYPGTEVPVEPRREGRRAQFEVVPQGDQVQVTVTPAGAVPVDDAADASPVDQHVARVEVDVHEVVTGQLVGVQATGPGQQCGRTGGVGGDRV